MERNQKITLAVLAAVVIVGGVAVAVSQKKHSQNTVAPHDDVATKTDAPSGQLVGDFPKELVLDPKATPNQSYNMSYTQQNQSTVELTSALEPKKLIALYQNYFQTNGFTILNQSISSDNLQSVYAVKGKEEVNVVAQRTVPTKTNLTLTYLKK